MTHACMRRAPALTPLLTMLALALGGPSGVRAQSDVVGAQPADGAQPAGLSGGLGLSSSSAPARETNCTDRQDDDGDGLADCADADCYDVAVCHAGGNEETTNQRCSDWIDNDGDSAVDCDDSQCQVPAITVCRGSWSGPAQGGGATTGGDDEVPELGEGQSLEDLIGRGGDANGERTDETCSDGIDNDADGRLDCADFGCRFDPQVSVCNGQPGMRFSLVAGVGASLQWNYDQPVGGTETSSFEPTARFTLLQLRALGPIPFIENSFFLVNVRAEDRVRLSFLMFQVPISSSGHYFQLNSGFGGLSAGLIISAARQPLLDPPQYLYSRFEQGNGAAVEVGGPIDSAGVSRFRLFAAGGSGEFSGSVGGGFFRSDERNFSWAVGGQFQLNLMGRYDRFDSPLLYVPDPGTAAISVGTKYDQRAAERFVGVNGTAVFNYWHFGLRAESYTGIIMDDVMGNVPVQTAFNVTANALIVPRVLALAADVGGYYQPVDYAVGPPTDPAFRNQLETLQWRTALHWYAWRSTGVLTLLYREQYQQQDTRSRQFETERQLRLEARFRF
jgi:hypothetical protein